MRNIAAIFNEALAALNGRDLGKAEEGFRRVIKFEPEAFASDDRALAIAPQAAPEMARPGQCLRGYRAL